MEAVGEHGGLDLQQTRVLADISSGYTEFQDGDVVVAKITPCFENGKAALARCLLNGAAYGTTELHVLRAGPTLDRGFLFYVTVSDTFLKLGESEMYGAGGQKRVPPEFIKDFPMPLPPLAEQRQIAAFLDWKTRQIDALIARKKELLEKLKEKRIAVITQAVTRGLNPDAPLRASGIPWLGQVPMHWEVKKFSYISRVVRGASPRPAGDPTFFNGDFIPWITVGEITKEERIYLDSTETMLTEAGASNSRVMKAATLVITNSGATLGVPKILSITGCANDGVVAFEDLAEDVDKVFLFYFLRSQTEELRERMKQGGGQPNLNTDIIKALSVPLPPLEEQTRIAEFLTLVTRKLDAMADKVAEAIARLTEYRTALITAATTGKIDVRKETCK